MITVISAATISTLIVRISEKQGSNASVIRVLTGIFLAVCVVSPVMQISFDPITDFFKDVRTEADSLTEQAAADLNSEKETIIKQTLEAYILDKAESLGLTLRVSLELNEEMAPEYVSLSGNASPYGKRQLQTYISDTLGIPKEAQMWN